MSLWLRRRTNEALLALMLLSRLPAGRLKEPVPSLAEARWAYPLVGLVIGIMGWATLQLALIVGLGPLPSAALALLTLALVTGGLHHDGLADFADGIGGGRDRSHCLGIMQDSRIGSYGALALIFAVVIGAVALAEIAEKLPLSPLLLVSVSSRLIMLAVLIALPPARSGGLGHSAAARTGMTWLPGAIVTALLAVAVGPLSVALLVLVALAGCTVAVIARRHLGGQTGDVLGAVQMVSEVAGWLALSMILAE